MLLEFGAEKRAPSRFIHDPLFAPHNLKASCEEYITIEYYVSGRQQGLGELGSRGSWTHKLGTLFNEMPARRIHI